MSQIQGVGSQLRSNIGARHVRDTSSGAEATQSTGATRDAMDARLEEGAKKLEQFRASMAAGNVDVSSNPMFLQQVEQINSRVRDPQMAKELIEQTKSTLLMQGAMSMLAQANTQPQGVLQLLR